jgi:hypothetical protein
VKLLRTNFSDVTLNHTQSLKHNTELFAKRTHLPLYGCETWSVIQREAQRLGVFENRVLRRIFGPKGEEVVGGWRRLHNEERH